MNSFDKKALPNILFIFIFIISFLLCPLKNVRAVYFDKNIADLGEDFGERKTKYFVLIFPKSYEEMANQLFMLYGKTLDVEYEKFQALFDNAAIHPLTIRVYINEKEYKERNPFAPPLLPPGTHSHVGSREIALIGENITKNYMVWLSEASNAFRYELAILFAQHLSDQKAPPGLLNGIGAYAQDQNITEKLIQQTQNSSIQTQGWIELLENDTKLSDPSYQVQRVSVVSYLVGLKQWHTFLTYIEKLKTAPNYHSAFYEVYEREQSVLETEWQTYFPIYLHYDWQWNKIYNYNLTIAEKLIKEGAYSAALTDLEEAININTSMQQQEKKALAQKLYETAQIGKDANTILFQGRISLARGNAQDGLSLLTQAQQKFALINNSQHNVEIKALKERAEMVIALQGEIERYQKNTILDLLDMGAIKRIQEIRTIFDQIDDEYGQRQVESVFQSLQKRQQNVIMVGILLAMLLIIIRLWRLRYSSPPEANL